MSPIRRTKHAVYDLKYHFVWIPKYRKKLITGEVSEYVGKIFRRIAEEYEWEIDEMAIENDHVHLFIQVPPKYSPAKVVQIVKSISAREIFRRYPGIREQLWGGEIWSDGYFVWSVGDKVTAEIIKKYIRYHKTEAHLPEQLKLWGNLLLLLVLRGRWVCGKLISDLIQLGHVDRNPSMTLYT